jgi:hypothetical protein
MADPAIQWTKVLVHPLGLAGYALFLVFGLVAVLKRRDERRWMLRAASAAAGIALLGGIGLAYRDVGRQAQTVAHPASTATPTLQQQNDHPQQRNSGANSPNVQGVQGDVNFTYGASPAPEQHKRDQRKQPTQKKNRQ